MSKVLKVGILGSGDVARSFAKGCLDLGYAVKLGSRERGNPAVVDWAKTQGEKASAGTFAEAAAWADVVVIATLGQATEDVIKAAGADHLKGKVAIDVTNPLVFSEGQPPHLFVSGTDSLAERIQRLAPGARVVKAFNTVGHGLFVKPTFKSGTPDMFLAGNDPEAKRIVSGLCGKWGWRPIDVGDLAGARGLEAMVLVWIRRGVVSGQWTHAFKLLTE